MDENKNPRKILCEAGYEEAVVLCQDFDTAIIGITEDGRVVYDHEKMVKKMMDQYGIERKDAINYIDHTTVIAVPFIENGPIIIHMIEDLI